MSYQELLEAIALNEKNGTYDNHLSEVDPSIIIPVDETYPYIKKGFKLRFLTFLHTLIIIWPYSFYLNKFKFRTKIVGKKNIKGLKQAVFTCNHVDMFDCLVVKRAMRPRVIKSVAASFNNRKGKLGSFMRSGGMMPLSETFLGMKKFNEGIKHYVSKGASLLIYPEQALWWHYQKPRPHKIGAYHFAVKYDLPIVPLYITFKDTGKKDKNGYPKHRFTLHIMEPIYKDDSLSRGLQANQMMERNMDVYNRKYREIYKGDL